MNFIVIHGDNTIESYVRLQKFINSAKSRNWEILYLEENNQNLAEIISSQSLFVKDRLIIAKDIKYFSPKILKWLNKNDSNFKETIVFYQGSTLTASKIKLFPKSTKFEEYKIPVFLWKFLDSFYPKNAKTTLKLLHQVTNNFPIEFVFSLLAKQVRDLYWAKTDPKSMKYPSWRLAKLKSQTDKFSEQKLKDLIDDLAIADIKVKTSQGNLIDLLDFIIITKLE